MNAQDLHTSTVRDDPVSWVFLANRSRAAVFVHFQASAVSGFSGSSMLGGIEEIDGGQPVSPQSWLVLYCGANAKVERVRTHRRPRRVKRMAESVLIYTHSVMSARFPNVRSLRTLMFLRYWVYR